MVQKYIENPLLIGGPQWYNTPYRKFDIRVFGLAQIVGSNAFRGYFYQEGYIRTSSFKYSNGNLTDRDTHLTNDAVQLQHTEYGKYEPGNKVSFKDFETYLMAHRGVSFREQILPRIRDAVRDTLAAFWSRLQLLQETAKIQVIYNQFELLGYDFMIDEDLNVYLIEVNTNPCLDTPPCTLLQRLITQVLDQTFKIAVDPFLRAKDIQYQMAQEMTLSELNYEMIYSDTASINQLLSPRLSPELIGDESQTDVLFMDPVVPQMTSLDDDGLELKSSNQ